MVCFVAGRNISTRNVTQDFDLQGKNLADKRFQAFFDARYISGHPDLKLSTHQLDQV